MTQYLAALALTLLAETIVVALLAGRTLRGRLVLVSLFANLLTHPLANHFFDGTFEGVVLVESAVFVVEALLFMVVGGCRPLHAIALALVANVGSFLLSHYFV